MRKNPVKLEDLLPKKKTSQTKTGAELLADMEILKKRKPKAAKRPS